MVTYDGYEGRSSNSQLHEQVVVHLGSTSFGPTADLVDGVESTSASAVGEIELIEPAAAIVVSHVLGATDDNQSVGVRCVTLTATPPPATPPTADVGFACTPERTLLVSFENPGPSTHATVLVDGVATTVEVAETGSSTVSIPVSGGLHAVSIAVDAVAVFAGEIDVICEEQPADDLPHDELPPEDPPASDTADEDESGSDAADTDDDDGAEGGEPNDSANGESSNAETEEAELGSGEPDARHSDPAPAATVAPVVTPAPVGFRPTLSLRVVCSDGVIEAAVANDGDTTGRVTVAVAPSAAATSALINPATTTTLALPLPHDAEGSRTNVVLVTGDGNVLSDDVAVDCLAPAKPDVDVVVDCAAESIAVNVRNDGGEAVTVRAFTEQVAFLGANELLGGQEASYQVAIVGSSVALRVVGDDGQDLLRESVDHGCRQTEVDVGLSLRCPEGELEMRLSNPFTAARTVFVTAGGETDEVALGAGDAVLFGYLLAELDDRLTVTSAFGDVLLDEDVAAWACESNAEEWPCGPSCGGVQTQLVLDCVTGSAVVEVANDGEEHAVIDVRVDGERAAELNLAPFETSELVLLDAVGLLVTADRGGDRLLHTKALCSLGDDRTATVVSALLVVLMSIVAAVAARFDPWIRV
ncbi:MAG: hypothetical protein AAGA37_02345 [Actinomycetota bacterium]